MIDLPNKKLSKHYYSTTVLTAVLHIYKYINN